MGHIFSDAEMRRRLERFSGQLEARAIEVALLTTPDNVFYLTGMPLLSAWGRPLWALVWANGRSAVIGAGIEHETMERYAWADEVLTYGDEANVWDESLESAVALVARSGPPRRIGIERPFLAVDPYGALLEKTGAELVDVSDLLSGARLIKSDEELALLRLGGELARIGAEAFLTTLGPGVTELEVTGEAVAAMDRALGALQPDAASSSYAYCQFADHTLSPHRHPSGRRLERGDLVALNVFPVVWGYCIELERTLVFGEPTVEQHAALVAATAAFERAKELYRPGAAVRDIDAAATRILAAAGYEPYIRHGTGHAHGIMIGAAGREEAGELRSYNGGRVEPGMVNSIEPGIYLPEVGGFRHSDVLAATASGAELLTPFPVDLLL
jgi:creatinase